MSFISADQLLAHAIGDYVIQSDWMASEKTKKSLAAFVHVLTYTLPFLFITLAPTALVLITFTHYLIDRYRLARYVCWVKNWIALPVYSPAKNIPGHKGVWTWGNRPWSECQPTGYSPGRPDWLVVWLLIIADNTMHVICNGVAIKWLA